MKGSLKESERSLLSNSGLDELFQHEHVVEIAEGDEFLQSLWDRKVRPQLQIAMRTVGLSNYASVSGSNVRALNDIIDHEVPSLRKLSDPWAR